MNEREAEIVIVEDNPYDAELVTRVLQKHGLADKSSVFKDGVEALDFLLAPGSSADKSGRRGPKVILLDLKLPKMDGIEVLRRLKSDERTRTIPVVALTSSSEQRDIKAAYELGVNSYVTKPIEFSRVAGIVGDLVKYWLQVNQLPSG